MFCVVFLHVCCEIEFIIFNLPVYSKCSFNQLLILAQKNHIRRLVMLLVLQQNLSWILLSWNSLSSWFPSFDYIRFFLFPLKSMILGSYPYKKCWYIFNSCSLQFVRIIFSTSLQRIISTAWWALFNVENDLINFWIIVIDIIPKKNWSNQHHTLRHSPDVT